MKTIYIGILSFGGFKKNVLLESPILEYYFPIQGCLKYIGEGEPMETTGLDIHKLKFHRAEIISDITDNEKEERTVRILYIFDGLD